MTVGTEGLRDSPGAGDPASAVWLGLGKVHCCQQCLAPSSPVLVGMGEAELTWRTAGLGQAGQVTPTLNSKGLQEWQQKIAF